jgi:hypothetical protein
LIYLHFFLQKGTTNRLLKAQEREAPLSRRKYACSEYYLKEEYYENKKYATEMTAI